MPRVCRPNSVPATVYFPRSVSRPIAFALMLVMCACSKRQATNEHTYALTATIVSRDAAQNAVTLDNKEVPGVMEAMRMDYRVGDAKVNALPPNGTPVNAMLHERDGDYWVTGVRPAK